MQYPWKVVKHMADDEYRFLTCSNFDSFLCDRRVKCIAGMLKASSPMAVHPYWTDANRICHECDNYKPRDDDDF